MTREWGHARRQRTWPNTATHLMSVGSLGLETWCMAAKDVEFVERFQPFPGGGVFEGGDLMSTETRDHRTIIKFWPGHPKWEKNRKAARQAHMRLHKEEDMRAYKKLQEERAMSRMRAQAQREYMGLMYGAQ